DKPIFTIGRQWVHKLIRRYGALIGRPDIHPHTLRHGFAINSIRHGVDIRRLQLALGHASLNTTAIYLNFNDRDMQEAYANVPF
ncbi:MAG: tyrosine-type recombinase/integrase, partial [Halobacteriota archaeon]